MKKLMLLLSLIALVAGGAGVAVAADQWQGEGEIVEMGCYKRKEATGEGHAACAKRCLGNGADMGLLSADGEVVKLVPGDDKAPYESLIELAGKQAKVTGMEKDGAIVVTAAAPAG